MSEVIRGQAAVVWGSQGITMTAGIVSATNPQQVESFDLERNGDKFDIKNSIGEVIGQVFYNNKKNRAAPKFCPILFFDIFFCVYVVPTYNYFFFNSAVSGADWKVSARAPELD